MGRRKIKIAPIGNKRVRQLTFNGRKNGLVKKLIEFSRSCSAEIGFLALFDSKSFVYSSSDGLSILQRYSSSEDIEEVWTNDDYETFTNRSKSSSAYLTTEDRSGRVKEKEILGKAIEFAIQERNFFLHSPDTTDTETESVSEFDGHTSRSNRDLPISFSELRIPQLSPDRSNENVNNHSSSNSTSSSPSNVEKGIHHGMYSEEYLFTDDIQDLTFPVDLTELFASESESTSPMSDDIEMKSLILSMPRIGSQVDDDDFDGRIRDLPSPPSKRRRD